MATCTTKLTVSLDPSCEALDKIGGVDELIYFGNLSEISYTTNVAGYVDSLVMAGSPAATLFKFQGTTKKNDAKVSLNVGNNTKTWKQTVIAKLYYYFPAERAAIEALTSAKDLVAIIKTEAGTYEVFGLNKGVRVSAAEGNYGVNIQDDTSLTVTIEGEEKELPKVLQLGAAIPGADAYLTETLDALNALL